MGCKAIRMTECLSYVCPALTKYVYSGVSQCSVIQTDLVHMLFALCAVYAIVFLTCVVVAVLALLAYRTERLHKRSLEVGVQFADSLSR